MMQDNQSPSLAPIVVVGSGPAGLRAAEALNQYLPDVSVLLYGKERWQPYNRIQLAMVISGDKEWKDLLLKPHIPNVTQHLSRPVVAIDREQKSITDFSGTVQPYSKLILATGSLPYVPDIPGNGLKGVFVFRDMDDAIQLSECRKQAHKTVVIGAGLLGIEVAVSMLGSGSEVTVIESSDRLLSRQLDGAASLLLQQHLEQRGIQLKVLDKVINILGERQVSGVCLGSGETIACDSVIISTGIHPNTELARNAGLKVQRGVCVNDCMQTSDPDIFAIGECAEHNGRVYGLVGPGLEQASVAAQSIAGTGGSYRGSLMVTRLKLSCLQVFSLGEVAGAHRFDPAFRQCVYTNPQNNTYRALTLRHNQVVGGQVVGQWDEIYRLQELVGSQRKLASWQLLLFRLTGSPWLERSEQQVADWSETTIVCNCSGVTRGQLSAAIKQGCNRLSALSAATGAADVCGACKPLLAQMLGEQLQREPVYAADKLFVMAVVVSLLGAMIQLLPGLALPASFFSVIPYDELWRNHQHKEISGYAMLIMLLLLAMIGLRKRSMRLTLGQYSLWRLLHVAGGLGLLLIFLLHTGGHMGSYLNHYLAISFVLLVLSGGLYALLLAREHKLKPLPRLKNVLLWLHVLALWPLPLLLGFHIIQQYYF